MGRATLPPERHSLFAHALGVFAAAAGLSTLHVGLSRLLAYVVLQAQALVVMSCAPFALALGVALVARPDRGRHPITPGLLAVGTQVSILGSLFLACQLEIPSVVSFRPATFLPLPLFGGLILLPFVVAGRLLISPFTRRPGPAGFLAGAGFVGVATAAASSSVVIATAGTPGAVALSAAWFALSATAFTGAGARARAGTLTGAVAFLCLGLTGWVDFPSATQKGLTRLVAGEQGDLAYHRWTPTERVDVLRFDPPRIRGGIMTLGAGQGRAGQVPGHYVIARDGDPAAAIYEWDGRESSLAFFKHHLLRAPYFAVEHPDTLVLQGAGGVDALVAVAEGAKTVRVAAANPALLEIGQEVFRDFNGNLLNLPQVRVDVAAARTLLREPQAYDVIAMHWAKTQVPLGLGMLDLSENQLQTREALMAYLNRLKPGGVLAISLLDRGGRQAHGRHLRLLHTVLRVLKDRGVAEPEAHVLALSGAPQTRRVRAKGRNAKPLRQLRLLELLVSNQAFGRPVQATLEAFAEREGFTLGLPGHAAEVLAGDLSTRDMLAAARRFVASDDRPLFFNVPVSSLFSLQTYQALFRPRLAALSPPPLIASVWVGVWNVLLVALWVFLRVLIDRKVPDILRPLGSLRGTSWLIFFAALGIAFSLLTLGVVQRLVTVDAQVTVGMDRLLPFLMVGCAIGAVLHLPRFSFIEAWVRWVLVVVAWVVLQRDGERWFDQFGLNENGHWVPLVAGLLFGGYVTFGVQQLFRDLRWAPPAIAAAFWGLGLGHSSGVLLAAEFGFSALPGVGLALLFIAIAAVHGAHGTVRFRKLGSLRPGPMDSSASQ